MHDPHEDIRAEIAGHPPTAQCSVDECMVCGARDCPLGEPGHYWKDGCPACYEAERARGM